MPAAAGAAPLEVKGGRLVDGKGCTAVSLPVAVHYARGYRVRARGARVVSRRNAQRLVVRVTTSRVRVRVSAR